MASPKNAKENSGVKPKEYAPPTGRMPPLTATRNNRMMASAKGGTLEKNSDPMKAPRSSQPPLNAATAPSRLPTIQPTMIAGSMIAILQGSACAIRVLTEAGYCANEVPRSPWNTLPT